MSAAPDDWLSLRIAAENFYDMQLVRLGIESRIDRGGVDADFYAPTLAAAEAAEKEAGKFLHAVYRRVAPAGVREWQKGALGIGEHLLARLLGAIGHPVHTTVYAWESEGRDKRTLVVVGDMDRSVSQLWSYCGHGDAERKRRKGMTADDAAALGKPSAKMLVHLLAESCMKQTARADANGEVTRDASAYRDVYDAARERVADREGWSDDHRKNHALRLTGKAILRDLWLAGGGAESGDGSQPGHATPRLIAPVAAAQKGQ